MERTHHPEGWNGWLVILETLMSWVGEGGTPSWPGFLLPPLTGGYSVALVLDELLDEAPVTWFRS